MRIAGVTPDSAAAKAGLHGGDRLVAVDGVAISGADADARMANARTVLGKLETGKPVRLGYIRDGRNATVTATPQLGDRLRLWTIEGATPGEPLALGVDPGVRTEVLRLQDLDPCKGDDCRLPLLADAFRWNGLNLAAVDSRLGRYFGTAAESLCSAPATRSRDCNRARAAADRRQGRGLAARGDGGTTCACGRNPCPGRIPARSQDCDHAGDGAQGDVVAVATGAARGATRTGCSTTALSTTRACRTTSRGTGRSAGVADHVVARAVSAAGSSFRGDPGVP